MCVCICSVCVCVCVCVCVYLLCQINCTKCCATFSSHCTEAILKTRPCYKAPPTHGRGIISPTLQATYTWFEIHRFHPSALKGHNGLESATVFCLKMVYIIQPSLQGAVVVVVVVVCVCVSLTLYGLIDSGIMSKSVRVINGVYPYMGQT